MSAYDRIVDKLRGDGRMVKPTREGQAQAQCPAHDDRNPSLSLTAIEGRVLLYCHAGCTDTAVLDALGLAVRDLFDEPRGVSYSYDDGRIVHRSPDKRFRQSGRTQGAPTLYRLSRVREAVAAGRTVLVLEGEQDVHAAETIGVTATCSPMGAGKWGKVDASPLYGGQVVIVADKDEPGLRHARDVLASLNGHASAAIFLPRAGKDLADHIAAGLGIEDLVVLNPDPDPSAADGFSHDVALELHRIRVRERAQEMNRAEKAGPVAPFDAGLLQELLARPIAPPERVEGLIPSDASTLIVAQRKTGKTTLELNLARCLLTGEDFLGRFPLRPVTGRVGLLNFEVSAAQLARWSDDQQIPADRFYLVTLRGRRNPLSNDDDKAALAAQLRAHGVETLLVDPFGRAYFGKSQNDPGEVGAWLADLDRWARGDAGVADLILSAHAGWDGERTRGASALEDWADSVITLVRDKDDASIRYMHAFGRDVEVEEDRLDYNPVTRTLILAGAGSRKVAAKSKRAADLIPAVVAAVEAEPGLSGGGIRKALQDQGHTFTKGDEINAANLAVEAGKLRTEPGPRKATLHFPFDSPASSEVECNDPPAPSRTIPTGESLTLPTPPYRGGRVRRVESPPDPPEPGGSDCRHPINVRGSNGKCALCIAAEKNAELRNALRACPDCGTELLPDGLCLTCAEGDTDVA